MIIIKSLRNVFGVIIFILLVLIDYSVLRGHDTSIPFILLNIYFIIFIIIEIYNFVQRRKNNNEIKLPIDRVSIKITRLIILFFLIAYSMNNSYYGENIVFYAHGIALFIIVIYGYIILMIDRKHVIDKKKEQINKNERFENRFNTNTEQLLNDFYNIFIDFEESWAKKDKERLYKLLSGNLYYYLDKLEITDKLSVIKVNKLNESFISNYMSNNNIDVFFNVDCYDYISYTNNNMELINKKYIVTFINDNNNWIIDKIFEVKEEK